MIKLVILDFDGTLADTRPIIVNTMQQTIEALSLPPRTDEECAAMIGLPLRQTFKELIPMDEETAERCETTYRELFFRNNRPGVVPVFPHVVETIHQLYDGGLELTIASCRSRRSLLDFLREMRLEECVSHVIAADDIERAKPAPDMVLRLLELTGHKAEETIVVGDTKYDIEMGHRAGVKACGVTYGNGSREELAAADYLIDCFADLKPILSI